ncbi:MAG: DUF4296 domain-containing protein [Cryomorphaceae bacterium]|nr:DUF4296 domain-containing protein [Cryomorphaceae bacterium]
MGKHLILFAVSLLLTSCKVPPVQIPEDVLDKETMVDLMVDVHLAEGGRAGGSKMYNEAHIVDFYEAIYLKYGLDKTSFDHSFSFYNQHPELMLEVHDKVIRRLNEIDAQLEKSRDVSSDSLHLQKEESTNNDTVAQDTVVAIEPIEN